MMKITRRNLLNVSATATVGAAVPNLSSASHVTAPSRFVEPPPTLSPVAQAYLRNGAKRPSEPPPPALTDSEGWRAYVAKGDAQLPIDALLKIPGVDIEIRKTGDATFYLATPKNISAPDRRKAHLYIHGGGWIYFGGRGAMALTKVIALQYGGTVFGVDYRMPPDHMAPAALDDCLAVYREMLKQYDPSSILVSGESAGGNLAAALMLKARDVGLPAPSALFLNTPATDLTCEGDSWKTNDGLDPVLRGPLRDGGSMDLYLNGGDARNPYFSPLFGDLTRGFPPTYLRTGTRDRLLSDTVRMHAALRAAGVEADLYVAEAMPHSGFGGMSPEDNAAFADTIRWLKKHWRASSTKPT